MARMMPGVKGKMGRWTYYMVRMTMQDLTSIKFAYEIEAGDALEMALQRPLNEKRAKEGIATYLQKQPDRFFNSIVIAALGGEPKWMAIDLTADPQLTLVADDETLMGSFGILRFNGQENYYALDGQHRLSAIKAMLNPSTNLYQFRPEGFEHEEQSVIIVMPEKADDLNEFRKRFRRLFGHLNRYAKPMDLATSIIVDEDDAIAIITRRLFREHEFFKSVGADRDSKVVDTTSGKNITDHRASHLTKLEVLYSINGILLNSATRQFQGWDDGNGQDLAEFIRFRPEEEVLDSLYQELSTYWDAILQTFPEMLNDGGSMRTHASIDKESETTERDSLLFWPLGQNILARAIREIFDHKDVEAGDLEAAVQALSPLSVIDWHMGASPWRHFTVKFEDEKWKMRSDDRNKIINQGASMLTAAAIYGADIQEQVLESLKRTWQGLLLPNQPEEISEALWDEARENLGLGA